MADQVVSIPLDKLHPFPNHPFEIRDDDAIEIELERELDTGQSAPALLGRYENVSLSEKELSELQTELPGTWRQYIERLSEYMASTGKKYSSHAATIRRWAAEDRKKDVSKGGIPEYTCKEGESL